MQIDFNIFRYNVPLDYWVNLVTSCGCRQLGYGCTTL